MVHKKYDQVSKVLTRMATQNGAQLPKRESGADEKDLEQLLQVTENSWLLFGGWCCLKVMFCIIDFIMILSYEENITVI